MLVEKVGYVQVRETAGGVQRSIIMLHQLAAIANVYTAGGPDVQASHLCGRSVCFNPSHVIWESAADNNQRKGCLAWTSLEHSHIDTPEEPCYKKVAACNHNPPCIRAIPGVTEDDFLECPSRYLHLPVRS